MTDSEINIKFSNSREKIHGWIEKKCDRVIILNNISHYIKTGKHLRPFTSFEKQFIIKNKI